MRREKIVSSGKQYAPTLYTVLVNADDDQRLFGFYPTLAGETETRLASAAAEDGLYMDCQPLVRFIVDDGLKHGKFDVIAEVVSAPILAQLREEEMQRYGLSSPAPAQAAYGRGAQRANASAYGAYTPAAQSQQAYGAYAPGQGAYPEHDPYAARDIPPVEGASRDPRPPLPKVDENDIAYGTDYGEYTFNSANFNGGGASQGFAGQNAASQGFANQSNVASRPLSASQIPSIDLAPSAGAAAAPASAGAASAGAGAGYGAAAAGVAAGAAVGAAAGAAYGAAQPTSVFAAGAAQVNPTPSASAVRARLLDTASGRSYDLAANRVLLGRETTNNIVVNDLNASRQHAQIAYEPQGVWVITDLGSTNGTLVNGAPVTQHTLQDGDRITLGITDFVFSLR